MQPFFFQTDYRTICWKGYQNKPLSTKQTLPYEKVMYLNEENRYTCIVRKLMETKGETKTFNVGKYRNNFVSHLFCRCTCIIRKLMETKGETKTFNVGTYRNNFVSHLFCRSGT